jgi:hypothetical protein
MLPTLGHEQLCKLIDQLQRERIDAGCREVVFDLSRVEKIGPQWTVVLAHLISFAHSCPARCRVISLQRQPASVFELYHRNREVASLLENGRMPFSPAARRSVAIGRANRVYGHDLGESGPSGKMPMNSSTEGSSSGWQRTCIRNRRALTTEEMKSAA